MKYFIGLVCTIAALLLGAPHNARAAVESTPAWADNPSGSIGLVAATSGAGSADRLEFGLAFRLAPGWKVYWRTPGDAGYPPKIDWSKSENLGPPVISWPAPKRFVLAGLQNYGYSDEVVVPITAPVERPGEAVRIAASVDYLACAEICVPMQADLALDVPAGPAEPTDSFHDISRFKALIPSDGARQGLALGAVDVTQGQEGESLRLVVSSTAKLSQPDVFVEGPEGTAFGQPVVTLTDGSHKAVMAVPVTQASGSLVGTPLTITVVDGLRAMEAERAPAAALAGTSTPDGPAPGLIAMLALALLGGLILNLMPCVLPVLSLKVLGVIGHGGADTRHIRAAFLASAAGIITSFLALAAAALLVRAAGHAVGWGIQFQQPAFLAAMVVVVGFFAANLWGWFDIPMPWWLLSAPPGKVAHHTLLGHFLTGAFATLLATPCSAPFLGTAVGFALARGQAEILLIFTALGLGMAAPYLVMAARPAAAAWMPKPGKWMVTLRQGLGLLLLGTAAWMLTVLAGVAGSLAAVLAGVGLAATLAALAARTRLRASARDLASGIALGFAVVTLFAPLYFSRGGERAQAAQGTETIPWVKFDPAAVSQAISDGKVVFVDVTADWCITCKVNKAVVVERGAVRERLNDEGVVAMKADWTRPDPAIAAYLASFGRFGIPFNAVYGPGAPDGIALSELLTEAEVMAALDQARR